MKLAIFEETVLGTEAVLSTVGPPQRHPKHPEKYEQAIKDLLAAMDLADFMLAQIDSKKWIRKAPLVATPR